MSDLVYRRHGGLLLAERSADFESVERALKTFDRELVLNVEFDQAHQMSVYEVHKVYSRDRPALFVCGWRDARGVPLPLSSALIDEVKRLHPDSRGTRGGLSTDQVADRENKQIYARETKQTQDEATEVLRDLLPRMKGKRIPVLHRGRHLLRSRHKPGGRHNQ